MGPFRRTLQTPRSTLRCGVVAVVLALPACRDSGSSSGAAGGAASSRGSGGTTGSSGSGGSPASGGSGSGGDSRGATGGSGGEATGGGGADSTMGGTVGDTATGGSGGDGASSGTSNGAAAGAAGEQGTGGTADCAPFEMPDDCMAASDGPLPSELRCTGLYGDWEAREYRCDVREYAPAFALWSDGAEKHRYVYLPPGSQVDVTDPESFDYPVGTQFWKEFWLPNGDERVLGETRLMRKTELGWIYTSYVWSEDGDEAIQTNDGVLDLLGTGHTVPTRDQCADCHEGRNDFILGWDFLMLGEGASGVTLQDLIDEDRLTVDSSASLPDFSDWLDVTIPGDSVERAALGYLHANCGVSCHNREDKAKAQSTNFYLRLDVDTLDSVQSTDAVVTGINRMPGPQAELPPGPSDEYYDLRPLDRVRSLVVARMNVRTDAAMPRLGTNVVDDRGVEVVGAWVDAMSEDRGYPAPAP